MPRPPKDRRVGFVPDITYFKPAGVPLRDLDEVQLRVDELEAIRLKDLAGLDQDECAGLMGVSQSTLQRMLAAARAKVADALVMGKAIRIEGGQVSVAEPMPCDTAMPGRRGRRGPPWSNGSYNDQLGHGGKQK